MDKKQNAAVVAAVRTSEGFIEITSLQAIDQIVGGLLHADDAVCLVETQPQILSQKALAQSN